MSLSLNINRDDNRALYQQIAAQIKNQISVGRLPPGTRLPSVRQMATHLHVNRLTVHNAYSELQADGWVESTVGRGTFVVEHAQPMTMLSSTDDYVGADSVLRDIDPIKQMPTLRSLAYSEPDPALVPVDELFGNIVALRREAGNLMRYGSPQGDPALRVEITRMLEERGVQTMPDQVLITSGAMQGLSLATQILGERGETVLMGEPCYLGMVHIIKTFGLNPVTVPVDEEGVSIKAMERALQTHKPRFLYTVPGFQNPTGYCMSAQRRRDLLDLAEKYDFWIIEDDIYATLAYDAVPPLALKAWDNAERVIYVSSFSKVITPGFRIGYMVAPPALQNRLIAYRLANDVYSPALLQTAVTNFLRQGRLKAHLRRVLPIYRSRRDALMQAMERYMPSGVEWTVPSGGYSIWVTLPRPNMMAIYKAALERSIAFTPGEAFLTSRTNRHFRLCFSTQPAEDLTEIVAMLGEIIYEQMDITDLAPEADTLWTPLV